MAKKRKPVRPKPKRSSVRRRRRRPIELTTSSLTIRFTTEAELRERLEGLRALFAGFGTRGSLEAVSALDSCLSLVPAVQVVAKALAPKNFLPTEKLGETYLTSQERELFKARVVKGVTSGGCQISDDDVPADEGTTHSAVVLALRQNAHN